MVVAALMVLDRGDGKNYYGFNRPKIRRERRRSKTWIILEVQEGRWVISSEHDYKPEVKEGQRLVREYK